ncbi:MAG TPA: ABC transporter permease [Candidatus Hydrogenedentes bacterium]|nr:ABC transporter permease [Candidatus Hydrogenedentota bacterium]HRK33808.1 ABC transporter permease [Candidatus Hydrogenedentota bacterium]
MSSIVYSNIEGQGVVQALRDVVRNRGLLWDLVSKDLRARYRNAVMSYVWAVLQPLLMMLILYFVFGVVFQQRGANAAAGAPHYAVELLCALIFWQFFASCLSRATISLIENADLIKKVYFPREIVPIASMGNSVINLVIGFAVLLTLQILLGGSIGIGLMWVAVIFVIQCMLQVGLALLCSSLNVHFRDVGYSVEVALMMGFYATPIFYALDEVQTRAAEYPALVAVYMLNPLVGIVTAYRTAFLENRFPDLSVIGWPAFCAVAALVIGILVFRRNAPTIADHL